MKTPPPYDHENLTPEQYASLLALAEPIAYALKAGVPTTYVIEFVTHILDKAKARLPDLE